jgi:hypothetical protein
MVHFNFLGNHCAAIITAVETPGDPDSRVQLFVMPPDNHELGNNAHTTWWRAQGTDDNTWHWPEYVPTKYIGQEGGK